MNAFYWGYLQELARFNSSCITEELTATWVRSKDLELSAQLGGSSTGLRISSLELSWSESHVPPQAVVCGFCKAEGGSPDSFRVQHSRTCAVHLMGLVCFLPAPGRGLNHRKLFSTPAWQSQEGSNFKIVSWLHVACADLMPAHFLHSSRRCGFSEHRNMGWESLGITARESSVASMPFVFSRHQISLPLAGISLHRALEHPLRMSASYLRKCQAPKGKYHLTCQGAVWLADALIRENSPSALHLGTEVRRPESSQM